MGIPKVTRLSRASTAEKSACTRKHACVPT